MKIIKVGFSKTFPLQQYYEKIWMEAELNDEDDERQSLYALKKKVEDFFFESKGVVEKQKEKLPFEEGYVAPQGTTTVSREQAIINQINEVTDLKVLESFALLAKNNETIKDAYDFKLKQLQP